MPGPYDEERLELGRPRAGSGLLGRWLRSPLTLLVAAGVVGVTIHLRYGGSDPPPPLPPVTHHHHRAARDAGGLTSVQPGEMFSETRLGHPLLGQTTPWVLFARGDQDVVRIQPAGGDLATTVLPALRSSGPVSFVPTAAGVLVRPLDRVAGYEVTDSSLLRLLSGRLGQGGPVFPASHGRVWAPAGDDRRLLLTPSSGSAHDVIRLPRSASLPSALPDGSGFVLVPTRRGLADVRPGRVRLVTTGSLLAAGPTGWLVTECHRPGRCDVVLVDRRTGARRRLGPARHGPGTPYGVISPDGRTAAVVVGTPSRPQLRLLDLTGSGTGRRVALRLGRRTPVVAGSVVWSPDSAWLLVAGDRGLSAVAAHSGRVRPLVPLPPVVQLAVRSRP